MMLCISPDFGRIISHLNFGDHRGTSIDPSPGSSNLLSYVGYDAIFRSIADCVDSDKFQLPTTIV